MNFEDEDDTCDSFPWWLSPRIARVLLLQHEVHSCAAAVAARTVLDGANNWAWDEAEALVTPQDWVAAYEARHLPARINDGAVELVADDTLTAVLMPHALAAWVQDRIGGRTPTLAPPLGQLATGDWAFLVVPAAVPAEALTDLRRVGVRFLEPGQRLALPMTPDPVRESWWHEWPRRHGWYPELLATPAPVALLNAALWAAHCLHHLSGQREEIQYGALPSWLVEFEAYQ